MTAKPDGIPKMQSPASSVLWPARLGNKQPRRWARQVRIEKHARRVGPDGKARGTGEGCSGGSAACVWRVHGDVMCAARGSDSGNALRGIAAGASSRRCAANHRG